MVPNHRNYIQNTRNKSTSYYIIFSIALGRINPREKNFANLQHHPAKIHTDDSHLGISCEIIYVLFVPIKPGAT